MPQIGHHSDGDDELTRLYQMLARSRATTQKIEEAIARKEGTPTAEVVQRRRRAMRSVAWIPAIPAAAEFGRLAREHATHIAAAAGIAVGSAATALALTQLGPHQHHGTTPTARPMPPRVMPSPGRTPGTPTPRTTAMAVPPITPPAQPTSPRHASPRPTATPTTVVGMPGMPPVVTAPTSPGARCVAELRGPVTLRLLCHLT